MMRKRMPRRKTIKARKDLSAFITGSYAYGEPRPDSDIDLVLFMDHNEAYELEKLSDKPDSKAEEDVIDSYGGMGGKCLRFGKLNLLIITNKKVYRMWRKGTEMLTRKKGRTHPVTRGYAIKFLDKLFYKTIPGWYEEQRRIRRAREDRDEDDEDEDLDDPPVKKKPSRKGDEDVEY